MSSDTEVGEASTPRRIFQGRQVISLLDLGFEGRPKNIGVGSPQAYLLQELREQGWVFVCDVKEIGKWIPKCRREYPVQSLAVNLNTFFHQPQALKEAHAAAHGFGYSSFDHKEGLRVLTGLKLERDFKGLLPPGSEELYAQLSQYLDHVSMYLSMKLAPLLFGREPSALAQAADVPVAYLPQRHFGMLDAAHYFNAREAPVPQPKMGSSIDDVNCVPHSDPGLLSISFFSDNDGLELLDPRTGQWVPGPVNTRPEEEDIAVIWLGEAAVKAVADGKEKVQAGVHRVVYPPNGKDRLGVWYEMCTLSQVTPPEETGEHNGGAIQIPNMPSSTPVIVEKNEKLVNVLTKIERKYGIPRTKVFRLDDLFKAMQSDTKKPAH